MDKLIIGVWQGPCRDGDLAANLATVERVIDQAAEAGCKFLCLPEQFLAGYGKREYLEAAAVNLDDERLTALARRAEAHDMVVMVGISERRGRSFANTQVVLHGGRLAGHYTKTMLIVGDRRVMADFDDELPVFDAHGVRYGIIICHDSSFPEIAATLAWKGARIIFSPHYNAIARGRMDDHRILVRNNHVGIAAHYGVVLARANVVGDWPDEGRLGYGDSAIFAPSGQAIAEAGLFTEALVTADVAPYLARSAWRKRSELRPAVIDQLHQAAIDALKAGKEAES